MRIVCRRCARFIDIQNGRDLTIAMLQLYAAIAIFAVIVVLLLLKVITIP